MNLEEFIKWEKNLLLEERERLKHVNENEENSTKKNEEHACPAKLLLEANPNVQYNCNRVESAKCSRLSKNEANSSEMSTAQKKGSSAERKTNSSLVTVGPNINARNNVQTPILQSTPEELCSETFSFYTHSSPEYENENTTHTEQRRDDYSLTKSAKNVVNQQTVSCANVVTNVSSNVAGEFSNQKKEDDMEQWVTDTFYSYFPGFNDELQKRQRYLRERQQENQQNLIKHQLTHPPLKKHGIQRNRNEKTDEAINTARSASTSTTVNTNSSTMSHSTNKTDLEIIVNNPGYVPPKQHTPRNKLLQDLRHTELSNIVAGDDVTQRNYHAEVLSARKKDYQRELMQQIEEKRRSIEILREKERRQEEVLTRRLQEQLKTIKLEEELEKEKMRADKARFDSEQNRIMREQLLAKLENDAKLSDTKRRSQEDKPGTATTADVVATASAENNNKVYKYFSNSARHEYRRGKPMPEELEIDVDTSKLGDMRDGDEFECFHLSEKVCPMCDAPLKTYESCCLRCQMKLSVRMQARQNTSKPNDKTDFVILPTETENFSMVCEKCERLYVLCPTCLAQNDVCKACHRKRNVCMNCRRSLCTRCLDEIACGRDTERSHINDIDDGRNRVALNKNESDSVHSFKVLEVNYGGAGDDQKNQNELNFISPMRTLYNDTPEPPYSMSIDRNSVFHPDYNTIKETASNDQLENMPSEEFNIERVRKETDNRLSRYLRNYGDLAVNPRLRSRSESGQDRSTQTTPNTAGRRDIVMHEEYNLSMPLLREMPKMTRSESNRLLHKKPTHGISNRIEQLKQRWEVPAVQKHKVSSTSPKVLTQVGAIRKQLQADCILNDRFE